MNRMLFWQIIFGTVLLKSPEDINSHGSQPNCVALCQEKLPLKASGILFSPVLCARRAGSIVIFVFWSRFTYVLDYILTSHYFLLLLKVIELDQKNHSKIVKFSVAIMGTLENIVILMRVRQDALLAPLEFPSQVTNTTFLASIKLLRKDEYWEYIMPVEKWKIRTLISFSGTMILWEAF